MQYIFAPHLLLRMPVKIPVAYRTELQSFLEDQFFMAALKVATPSFFNILERRNFHLEKLSIKEINTLQKYVNRYCFRPTPFGLFSSISLMEWADKISDINRLADFTAHIRAAMPFQTMLGTYLMDHQLPEHSKFEGNPSVYRVHNEYRFFRTGLDETGKQREYQLQSIAFSKVLKDVLAGCNKKCSKSNIVHQIARSAECELTDAVEYADFLIEAQLLVNTSRISVTGSDYLILLASKIDNRETKMNLQQVITRQNNKGTNIDLISINRLEQDLENLLPDHKINSALY